MYCFLFLKKLINIKITKNNIKITPVIRTPIVKAEDIVKRENNVLKDWQKNTQDLNELMTIWKTLGPAPKKYNDQVWERFRVSFDAFFSAKKDFFAEIKEQHDAQSMTLREELEAAGVSLEAKVEALWQAVMEENTAAADVLKTAIEDIEERRQSDGEA